MTYTASHSAAFRRPARRRIGLSTVLAAWRSRQQLKVLDDRALADIGLTRSEAQAEASRPIWDVPATWRN
ncbi:DUF1127 domain-containing protein [Aestuariivita sp.]|jgi:uncharacterized protein YjiS (DUF1127 family)|uniref:DUF1127 domain-containing protein n=1 Tax=Aestuariivita sp. TaxID=1872407 RepID=UPI0021723FE1|nr:DUF1127 domain-containing protein [Aestuariivita sp.]MCE8009348.1 DUF1127 domain-containing protein [Aestuariivita sp.]